MTDIPSASPVKPNRMTTRIVTEGDVTHVSMREGHWGLGLFLLLWLIGWTVACVALIWMVITKKEPFIILFGVPFWISWIFVVGLTLNNFLGRRHLVLGPEGLIHKICVFLTFSRRDVPLSEIMHFKVRKMSTDSEEGPKTVIEVRTLGRGITLASAVNDLERNWLCWFLEDQLIQLKNRAGLSKIPVGDLDDCRRCERPTDCAWQVDEFSDRLTFYQRGRLSVAAILGLVFINGFWNGIVAVFLGALFGLGPDKNAAPRGFEWLGMFLFLIPFEIVGLVMFGLLLLQLLEPVRVTRWIFDGEQIARITTRFGLPLGLRKAYWHTGMSNVAVRDDLSTTSKKVTLAQARQNLTGDHYGLLISDSSNSEICSVLELTLGEARWIKGQLQSDPQFNLSRHL